jgi:hypothetical protein
MVEALMVGQDSLMEDLLYTPEKGVEGIIS